MNSWGNDQYAMQGMGMPPPMPVMNNMPPMMAPMMQMMPDVPPMNPPPAMPMIGPIQPDMDIENQTELEGDQQKNDVTSTQNSRHFNSDRSRRDRDYPGRRGRSRSRERHDRYDRRDRNDRDRDRSDNNRNRRDRERKSKWDHNKEDTSSQMQQQIANNMLGNSNMIPGMVPFQHILNNVMQPMDGQQMLGMVPQMNMMGGMLPNVMDQGMMFSQQNNTMPVPNQPIYISNGVLLPPIMGVSTPQRREKPKGCRTVFVGGLQHGVNTDNVTEIFQRFGNIVDIKSPRRGVFYVRFERPESVEQSFFLSGYRMKAHEQSENEATTMFVDYALNRDDQNEYERKQRHREPTPPKVELFTQTTLNDITDKIKSEEEFAKAAPTLAAWLERGECNKKNANTFYSLIQTTNNQIRRLFNEKMQLDDEFLNMKTTIKDKYCHVIHQFEQVAKILSAAKHQRVSDHFTKQQRRNIEMWLKMTEELENMKEEYNTTFEEEETERVTKNMVSAEKYEELRKENENLTYELEGYKNEAYLAKDEAERKFEKFKAHFIAQQALQNKHLYPPLPTQQQVQQPPQHHANKPLPPPPTPDDNKVITSGPVVPPSEAKLISILTAFLMVHPLGASLDYLVSYVRSMTPNVTQGTVLNILQKYNDVFLCKTTGVGATIEHRWGFVTFDIIKKEF